MARRGPTRCLIVPSLAALAACGGGESTGEARVFRRGDTTIVVDNPPRLMDTARLEPRLQVGLVAGPEKYLFGHVSGLAVDTDGTLLVLDTQYGTLRRFSRDGRFLQTIAGPGHGPGEIESGGGVAVLADGRIVVRDAPGLSIQVYGADGLFMTEWRIAGVQGSRIRNALVPLADGRLALGVRTSLPLTGTESTEVWPRPLFLVVDGYDGQVVDTIWGEKRFLAKCLPKEPRFAFGIQGDIRKFYKPTVQWVLGRSSWLGIGCPATFSLDLIMSGGLVTRVERPTFNPPAVSGTEWDAFRRLVAAQLRGTSRERGGDLIGNVEKPSSKPAYAALLASDDDRLWVFLTRPSVEVRIDPPPPAGFPDTYWKEPRGGIAAVFDRNGDFLGPVALPSLVAFDPYDALSVPPVVRGDTVWAVTVDSVGVESITRFQTQPSLSAEGSSERAAGTTRHTRGPFHSATFRTEGLRPPG